MTKPAITDLQRLADLPEQIQQQERIILGLKDAKRKAQGKKKAAEARVRLSEEVKSEPRAEERAAAWVLACEDNPEWIKATDRLAELERTLDSHEAQRDYLRRERDSLNTLLMNRVAERMEKVLADKDWKSAVSAGLLA